MLVSFAVMFFQMSSVILCCEYCRPWLIHPRSDHLILDVSSGCNNWFS